MRIKYAQKLIISRSVTKWFSKQYVTGIYDDDVDKTTAMMIINADAQDKTARKTQLSF